MNSNFNILLGILVVLHQFSEGTSQEHIVTKIPEKEVCYIKVLATTDDWQSVQETREKSVIRSFRAQSRSANTPVEAMTAIMKIVREIPREELSQEVLDFCGNNSAYLVEEKIITAKTGKSLVKRSLKRYRFRLSSGQRTQNVKRTLPNGYLSCKKTQAHNNLLFGCLARGKTPMIGCGSYPLKCGYQAICHPLSGGKKKIPSKDSIQRRAREFRDTVPKFHWVDIKCVEKHQFTAHWCCDILPCT